MSRDEAIKVLKESHDYENLRTEIVDLKDEIQGLKNLLLSVIVVQQKDACEAAGITSKTIRNKALRGEIEVLQRDGSSLNFLTLATVGDLKPRKSQKRRKGREQS